MSDGADFIGRGILWPLRVDQSGSIALGSGPDDINASIRMAIMTAPGERVMRPQFGCRIWDLLFEPINANTLGLMGEAIRDTVSQWEPRVDLEDVSVEPDPASASRVTIDAALPGQGDQRPPQPRLPVLRHPARGRTMSLPVPNLDDRSFQDLVDEAKRLIPTYCPEWTNHNLTDPGVALIELFAWMTELSLFRLNQVPDKFYTHMLNMMGFEPFPATAARTDLTFWLVDVVDEPVSVPAGTEVSTSGEIGASRVFTTLSDLWIRQPHLMGALVSPGPDSYVDVWDALRLANQAVVCFPRTPTTPGDRFYLGFENSLSGNAIRMEVAANVEGIGVIPTKPPLRWEVWQGSGWIPCTVYRDTTGGLNRDGQITLLVPPAHEPLTLGGQRAFWMRARVLEPEPGQPTYRASPQIRQIRVDSIGGSVTAEHSDDAPREVLGTSNGRPDQRFVTRHAPVLPRSHDGGRPGRRR